MVDDIVQVHNALFSVYHKEGLVEMARILHGAGVALYSSGGTGDALKADGLPVTTVQEYTGLGKMFGHRVATLHPKVHGGILYRRDVPEDVEEAARHGIIPLDMIVVNMYPVHEAIASGDFGKVVELTDIGGPAMLRGAAKNHSHVVVVADPTDYLPVARAVAEHGGLALLDRLRLAEKLYDLTSRYDAMVSDAYLVEVGRLEAQGARSVL